MPRPRTLLAAAAGFAALLSAPGCVMPDDVSQLRKDVADVKAELQTIRKEQTDARTAMAAVQEKVEASGEVKRSEFADLQARLDEMDRTVAAAAQRADDAQSRTERVSQDVTRLRESVRRSSESIPAPSPVTPPSANPTGEQPPASTPPPGAAGGGAGSAAPAPEALYNQAYSDFSKGNYALAAAGFDEYATRFPDSDQADNALYWIGECHFSEAHYDQAVEAFDKLLEKYPDSDRAPAANLKKGLAYLEQNDLRLAIVQLQHVVRTFPASDEAKIAKDKLASLGVR